MAGLLGQLPRPSDALAWIHGEDGMVGWGTAASIEPSGRDRFAEAQSWWDDLTSRSVVSGSAQGRFGAPIALVRMSYWDSSADSILRVPQVLLWQRDGSRWQITADSPSSDAGQIPEVAPITVPTDLRYRPGSITPTSHRAAVSRAVERIRGGVLQKVVLGRDVIVESTAELDQRWILSRLASLFPTCSVFAINGLLGASPELLLRVHQDCFEVLVLAGTSWPSGDVDHASATGLLDSDKNRGEHALAVDSTLGALRPLSAQLHVSPTPAVLRLPNVNHLATRVWGRLAAPAPGPLRILGQLHPTASVCGTPRVEAQRAIRDLEQMERGGYLGPVGWIDACGNAEFAIALRCAQLGTHSARLFAGGGIVAESSPEQEDAEVEAKLDAFRAALNCHHPQPLVLAADRDQTSGPASGSAVAPDSLTTHGSG